MIKKERPKALIEYQEFAKQYKDEYMKHRKVPSPQHFIKDAYGVRKNHESFEHFMKEYKFPEHPKVEELQKIKDQNRERRQAIKANREKKINERLTGESLTQHQEHVGEDRELSAVIDIEKKNVIKGTPKSKKVIKSVEDEADSFRKREAEKNKPL